MPHIDQNVPRTFYNPYPPGARRGATAPIPGPIRLVAEVLDGQTLPLREALKRLKAVGIGEIELNADGGYIGLRLPFGNGGFHFFRVIQFR